MNEYKVTQNIHYTAGCSLNPALAACVFQSNNAMTGLILYLSENMSNLIVDLNINI